MPFILQVYPVISFILPVLCDQLAYDSHSFVIDAARPSIHIVSWGNFGHLRALFLFWPSNSFGMGFGCPRSKLK